MSRFRETMGEHSPIVTRAEAQQIEKLRALTHPAPMLSPYPNIEARSEAVRAAAEQQNERKAYLIERLQEAKAKIQHDHAYALLKDRATHGFNRSR